MECGRQEGQSAEGLIDGALTRGASPNRPCDHCVAVFRDLHDRWAPLLSFKPAGIWRKIRQKFRLPAIDLKSMTNINAASAGMGLEDSRWCPWMPRSRL